MREPLARKAPWILSPVAAVLVCATSARFAAAATLGPPGSLVGFAPIAAPSGAHAWRIRYVSTGLDGKPIEVTGDVIASDSAGKERPVVAWAHGTSGIAEACAPSMRGAGLGLIAGLGDMIKRGFVVSATDYPGLGTPGPHPCLVGVSEGRAVLDSVRAARHIAGARAGARFSPWGESQGGHASLWTGQLAATYAPELKLVGVAAAAPPTDLYGLIKQQVESDHARVLVAYAMAAWSQVYGVPLDAVLDPPSIRALGFVKKFCVQTKLENYMYLFNNFFLGSKFLNERIHKDKAWSRLFQENAPGFSPPGTPYYISQGTEDKIVLPATTANYIERLCARGDPVLYARLIGVAHVKTGVDSAAGAVAWMADRFAGKPAPNDCASHPWL